jgi:Uncharacterized protein conserved in bacteria
MKEKLVKNLPLRLLALTIAAVLWLIVVNVDDPIGTRTYSGIKVTATNEDAITNGGRSYRIMANTDLVSVKIQAKRSVLNSLRVEDIIVTANMQELSLGTLVPLVVSIPRFEGEYDEAITTPHNMQVKIEENASKRFPITPKTQGNVRGGFAISSTSVSPETVTLQGPESIINRIDRVVAEVNVSGAAKDTGFPSELVLYASDDSVIDSTALSDNLGGEGVTVNVTINAVKRIPLYFDTSAIIMEEGYFLGEVIHEPKEIQVVGEEEALKQIKEIRIPKEVLDIPNLSEKKEVVVDIMPYLPKDIQLVEENGGSVIVTIFVEEEGTKTVIIPSGSIQAINVPVGLKWNYGDIEEVTLRIVGAEDVLNELTLDAQSVYINLTNFQSVGAHEVPVEVNLPEGTSLVGEVMLSVNLVKE